MAKIDLFKQSLNTFDPNGQVLPGQITGWDTATSNKEVVLDPTLDATLEVLPTDLVKLSTTNTFGAFLKVQPCTVAEDVPFGIIIFKTKRLAHAMKRNDIATVARNGDTLNVPCKTTIDAGAAIYYDVADGLYSNVDTGIKVGMALTAITTTNANGAPCRIEVQMPRV